MLVMLVLQRLRLEAVESKVTLDYLVKFCL